jgi:hypothetical protein
MSDKSARASRNNGESQVHLRSPAQVLNSFGSLALPMLDISLRSLRFFCGYS